MTYRIAFAGAMCGGSLAAWLLSGGGPSDRDSRDDLPAGTLRFKASAPGGPGDPAAALLKVLRSAGSGDKLKALEVRLPDLMRRDLPAAAALACTLQPHESREQVLLLVADTWARTSPDQAADFWAARLKDPSEISICLSATCRQVARTDPYHAITLAQAHGAADLTAGIAAQWMSRDLPAAAAWIEGLPDAEARGRHWLAAVVGLSEKSPREAATLAAEQIPPGPQQEEAVIAALHQWIRSDPAAAAAWVEDFPDGPLRERALGEFHDGH